MGYEANKRLKRDCQRVAFPVPMGRGGLLLRLSLVLMRCQPLRRALCTFLKSFLQIKLVHSVIMR